MHKFCIHYHCKVIKGEHAGELGKFIKEIGDGDVDDPLYFLVCENALDGIILPESYLTDELTDEEYERIWKISTIISGFNREYTQIVSTSFNGYGLIIIGHDAEYGIPHFHFYQLSENKEGIASALLGKGGCLCFEEAKYLVHGTHDAKLSEEDIDELIRVLNSKSLSGDYTVWDELLFAWYCENPEIILPEDLTIPNYNVNMETIPCTMEGDRICISST